MNVTERFLHYVSFPTMSDENSETCPSTKKQLLLAAELEKYRDAMVSDDIETLRLLLKDGRERKERSMEFYGMERRR